MSGVLSGVTVKTWWSSCSIRWGSMSSCHPGTRPTTYTCSRVRGRDVTGSGPGGIRVGRAGLGAVQGEGHRLVDDRALPCSDWSGRPTRASAWRSCPSRAGPSGRSAPQPQVGEWPPRARFDRQPEEIGASCVSIGLHDLSGGDVDLLDVAGERVAGPERRAARVEGDVEQTVEHPSGMLLME